MKTTLLLVAVVSGFAVLPRRVTISGTDYYRPTYVGFKNRFVISNKVFDPDRIFPSKGVTTLIHISILGVISHA